MDLSTRVVLSVTLLLAANHAVTRLPVLQDRALLFWAVQVLNLLGAVALLLVGIPGFEDIPVINWMLGLLLVLHVAQNLRWRAARLRAHEDDDDDDDLEARRSAIRAAIRED